eukprot:1901632-Pleurochrysis_carterae.AAC.1
MLKLSHTATTQALDPTLIRTHLMLLTLCPYHQILIPRQPRQTQNLRQIASCPRRIIAPAAQASTFSVNEVDAQYAGPPSVYLKGRHHTLVPYILHLPYPSGRAFRCKMRPFPTGTGNARARGIEHSERFVTHAGRSASASVPAAACVRTCAPGMSSGARSRSERDAGNVNRNLAACAHAKKRSNRKIMRDRT